MKDYIEREAVINDIGELFTICYETLPNECGHHFIVENELKTHLDFVKNLPASDVREVTLCRDCINRFMTPNGWRCHYVEWAIEDDDYCSCGERKGGAEMRGEEDGT